MVVVKSQERKVKNPLLLCFRIFTEEGVDFLVVYADADLFEHGTRPTRPFSDILQQTHGHKITN